MIYEDMGGAFCRQADTGELEVPQFLRRFESVVLKKFSSSRIQP